MTGEEYTANFNRIMLVVRFLMNEQQSLRELYELADRAETIGPFLDPTAWIHRRGGRNIAEQKQVLEALLRAIYELNKVDSLREAIALLQAQEAV